MTHSSPVKATRANNSEGIPWHALPTDTIISLHITHPAEGLTDAEADARRAILRKNVPEHHPFKWRFCLRTLHEVIKGILLVTCLAFAFFQQWRNAFAVLLVLLLNEWWAARDGRRTKQIRRIISRLENGKARVLRNGALATRPVAELVPGDVIELRAGDVVPADGRLLAAESLRCREDVLRALPGWADKSTAAVATDTPLSLRRGMIYMGTSVVSGTGRAIVVATGMDTALALPARPEREDPAPASRRNHSTSPNQSPIHETQNFPSGL